MKKNSYIEYLSKIQSKRSNKHGLKTLLTKRTVNSIYHRAARIEKIIGVDLDKILKGERASVENLFSKYNSVLKNIKHIKIYRSAISHYNNFISTSKK